jgi:hypothetical protein
LETLETQKVAKKEIKFYCEKCDYVTCKKFNYDKHITTIKHIMDPSFTDDIIYKKEDDKPFNCLYCKKVYVNRTGLWKHNKKCHASIILKNENTGGACDVVEQLIFQNKKMLGEIGEFKQIIKSQMESILILANKSTNNNITNNTNNISNNKFNLNVFLNEECKDAINISEFVDSLVINVNDLEETARLGYSEGISKILINGLNQLEVNKRPVHCSDAKREILYIKDDNKWNKENEVKPIITLAIKQVAKKNIKQIDEWKKLNPKYSDPTSKQNDKYHKLIGEAMCGSTKEETERNYEKIISNVARYSTINK